MRAYARALSVCVCVEKHSRRTTLRRSYELHKEAEAQSLYVKKAGGAGDYEGWCWPGSSGYPDFTSDKVRAWWGSRLAYDKYKGSTRILHVWNDMGEPVRALCERQSHLVSLTKRAHIGHTTCTQCRACSTGPR